ncbi:unnamed protein product, partial [Amoebophrya sp. A25]
KKRKKDSKVESPEQLTCSGTDELSTTAERHIDGTNHGTSAQEVRQHAKNVNVVEPKLDEYMSTTKATPVVHGKQDGPASDEQSNAAVVQGEGQKSELAPATAASWTSDDNAVTPAIAQG